jgi:hypothetical protein
VLFAESCTCRILHIDKVRGRTDNRKAGPSHHSLQRYWLGLSSVGLKPKGGIVKKIRWSKLACIVFAVCAGAALTSAQTITTLAIFDVTNGADPFSAWYRR